MVCRYVCLFVCTVVVVLIRAVLVLKGGVYCVIRSCRVGAESEVFGVVWLGIIYQEGRKDGS